MVEKQFNLGTTRSVKQEDQLVKAQRSVLSSVCCVIRVMVISTKHEQRDVKIVNGAVVVQMLHPKNSKNISGVHSSRTPINQRAWKRVPGRREALGLVDMLLQKWKFYQTGRISCALTIIGQSLSVTCTGSKKQPGCRQRGALSTYGIQALSNTTGDCLEDLQPCNHEEADSLVFACMSMPPHNATKSS